MESAIWLSACPRDATGPARLEIFEPEAAVVRRIYDDYVNGGQSIRPIMRSLNAEQIPTPTGKTEWWHSTLCRVLTNEAYVGRVYQPDRDHPHHQRDQQQTASRQPRGGDLVKNGSRSPARPSSMTPSSRRLSESVETTPGGVPATCTTRHGCCADWSVAAPATHASTPTNWAVTATAATSIATTPVATRRAAVSPASSSALSAAAG